MGPKYEHFKFELCQIVQQRINADHDGRKMFVMERTVQECPGGVQLYYKCRPQRECPQNYLENELEEYKPDQALSSEETETMLQHLQECRRRREAEALAKATLEGGTATPMTPEEVAAMWVTPQAVVVPLDDNTGPVS